MRNAGNIGSISTVSEIMFQLVALVLQRVEGLVLDLPAVPRTGLRLGARNGSSVIQVQGSRDAWRGTSLSAALPAACSTVSSTASPAAPKIAPKSAKFVHHRPRKPPIYGRISVHGELLDS